MAVYYIGNSERDIKNINIFAGSETIYGMNENENFAMLSLTDEDKNEPLSEKQKSLALESLRYGMEKFNLLDNEAIFVFKDSELLDSVMKITYPGLIVTRDKIKLVENLEEFNK